MAKFLQIIDVETDGRETILHPETTADYVEAGSTYKVPKISEITDWEAKSDEIEAARKGLPNLKGKIDAIDTSLQAANLLSTIKGVDGSGSGLDADLVDGKNVNDGDVSTSSLWTANKITTELGKKVNSSDITAVAAPNKILKLNSDSILPASINGNASTASTFRVPTTINLNGDVNGKLTIRGGETVSVDLSVVDNSHNHSQIKSSGVAAIETTGSGNIADFKKKGSVVSSIDDRGNFTGQAASVQGYTVSNTNPSQLWTGEKITQEIEKKFSELSKTGANFIKIGPVTYIYGEAQAKTVSSITIKLSPSVSSKIISESYIITSDNNNLTCVKDSRSNNSSIILNFNQTTSASTKVNWYIASI